MAHALLTYRGNGATRREAVVAQEDLASAKAAITAAGFVLDSVQDHTPAPAWGRLGFRAVADLDLSGLRHGPEVPEAMTWDRS